MKDLTKQQKNFLKNYAYSLDATKSALDGGYSDNVAHIQAKNLLSREKYQTALNSIIEKEVDKLEIPKAFILKKYLQVIDYASGECEGKHLVAQAFEGHQENENAHGAVRNFQAPKDATLLLKALEGLQRFLERANEQPKTSDTGAFWQIDNIDCSKI